MGSRIKSIDQLEMYWDILKKKKPQLFIKRNNAKRNQIAIHILDLWEDDYIKREFGFKISDQKYYEAKAFIFSIDEYSEIQGFVNNKDNFNCVYMEILEKRKTFLCR